MRTRMKILLPAFALAIAAGACGDYSRVENAGPGDDEKPAIVPERETAPVGAGLDSPESPDIHDPGTPGTQGPTAVEEGLEADRVLRDTVQRVP